MYFNETSNKLYTIGLVSGGDIKLYNSTTQIMCQVIAMLVFSQVKINQLIFWDYTQLKIS